MSNPVSSGETAQLSKARTELLNLLLQQESDGQPQLRPYPRQHYDSHPTAPASWAQQRFWFVDQLEGDNAAYHTAVALRLRGPLNRLAIRGALDALVRRHESLRTVFVNVDGHVQQVIVPTAAFDLRVTDLGQYQGEELERRVRGEESEETARRFDLGSGPVIRGRLLVLGSYEHVLLITLHHIVSDGWSLNLLTRELGILYSEFSQTAAGESELLPPLRIQYADYSQWQRDWLQGEVMTRQLSYWRNQLEGASPQLELPTDRPRPPTQSFRGKGLDVRLDPLLTARLKTFAKRHDCTLFMVLYAGWAILLSKLSNQEDIVVGTPVANRPHPDLEILIGLFVNTLVLRVHVHPDLPIERFLAQVKGVTLGAYDHQDIPFERLVEALQPERSLNRNPIFQVMLALKNVPSEREWFRDLTVTPETPVEEPALFDLLLSLEERDGAVVGNLNFAADLFDSQTIRRWIECYTVLLSNMTETAQCIGELSILPADERSRVIELFNATRATFADTSIHDLFEMQVQRTPQAPAVIHEGEALSYAELNARANQLAHFLIARGIGPDRLVGLCVERGLDMLIGLLGILKSGGAYVPLDPTYPIERLAYLLSDSSPQVIVTQQRLISRLPITSAALACLDYNWADIARYPTENPDCRRIGLLSSHLAYIIYTSGSTGQPKGVAIEHRNAVNLLCWALSEGRPGQFARTLCGTSLNFDLSVYECFAPLASGGTAVIAQNVFDLPRQSLSITLINTVPSAIASLVEHACLPKDVRTVNLAGEALPAAVVERIFESSAVESVCNLYGPSETTTYSTWIEMRRQTGFVPTIGRPIANTQIYILDRLKQPVPIGVTGEIYVGGAGVARGYLNRPTMTKERFLKDPFSRDPGARMYRTGDLGRWRVDGQIEYLGRNDHQVKLRGFRIELGEIEVQLRHHPQIKQAVVVVREDTPGDKRLVAYVTPLPGAQLDIQEVRTYLQSVLPNYMVPAAITSIARIPLNANGKVDRNALPAPEASSSAPPEYEAPEGRAEQILARIWQSVLRTERIGRHDNFFELGGHSLLIVQIMDQLRREALAASVRDFFERPTLSGLARVLQRAPLKGFDCPQNLIPLNCGSISPDMLPLVELTSAHIDRIVRAIPGGAPNIQDIYPLTPLQEGLLFHHSFNERPLDTYVILELLRVASRSRLDELLQALQTAINRHDALRTAILWERLPQPVQVVCRTATLPVEPIALHAHASVQSQIQDWLKPECQWLKLDQAPLMQVQVAAEPCSSHWYALLKIHHIICDHLALDILMSDVVHQLRGSREAAPAAVPYSNHVAQVLAQSRCRDSAEFFRRKLGDVESPTAPYGLLEVHSDGCNVEEVNTVLDDTLAARLRAQARRLGVSAATIFHAAWGLVVSRTTGRRDVVFGTVLFGQLKSNLSTERVLGMFINTLPLRLHVGSLKAEELIRHTHQELMELLEHEQASLAVAQSCSGVTGHQPLFTSLLNFRHSTPQGASDWSGAEGIELLATQERTNYPLVASIDDLGIGFALRVQTDQRIGPHRITTYLLKALEFLAVTAVHGPEREI